QRRRIPRQALAVASRAGVTRLDRRSQSQHHRFGGFEFVGVPLETHERTHSGPQLSCIVRPRDKVVASRFDAGETLMALGFGGDDHNRNETSCSTTLERAAYLDVVTARRKINEDQIWRLSRAGRERRVARFHTADVTPLFRKKPRKKPRANLIIVRDEDIGTLHRRR